MIREVMHIGLTVTDLDRSVAFYRDILGLEFQGEIMMSGEATDRLFARQNAAARIAYLNGSKELLAPPIELIQFTDQEIKQDRGDLFKTSVSEICFNCDDIDKVYADLVAKGVDFLSEPQEFDFTADGFGKSKAVYLRDPDGIILELMQVI
ncbi:MAG: VOC family protein [Eubacteriales bacterium]|nr:VOC family protein [Eubacteriales bacterium]